MTPLGTINQPSNQHLDPNLRKIRLLGVKSNVAANDIGGDGGARAKEARLPPAIGAPNIARRIRRIGEPDGEPDRQSRAPIEADPASEAATVVEATEAPYGTRQIGLTFSSEFARPDEPDWLGAWLAQLRLQGRSLALGRLVEAMRGDRDHPQRVIRSLRHFEIYSARLIDRLGLPTEDPAMRPIEIRWLWERYKAWRASERARYRSARARAGDADSSGARAHGIGKGTDRVPDTGSGPMPISGARGP